MEIQGKIVQILPLQSGVGKASGKEWKKQEFVLETLESQFPRKICFNLWSDLIDRTALQVGEDVTVQVDIESREYNGRWYTDVKGWRVDRGLVSIQNVGAVSAPAPQTGYSQPAPAPFGGVTPPTVSAAPQEVPAGGDDLPF